MRGKEVSNTVTTVQHTTRHVFTRSWVTLHHLVLWLEYGFCDFLCIQARVMRFVDGQDWSEASQREVDTGVWDQVSLEFIQIDIQFT